MSTIFLFASSNVPSIYRLGQKSRATKYRHMIIILSNLYRFQKNFTERFLGNFVVKWILKMPPHLAYVATLPYETLMSAKQAINDKLRGSLATYFKVWLLITKLGKVYCWVCQWIFFKSVNVWQSYKQERDYLMHFLCLLAMCWPGAQSAWDNHALACNFAKYSPILILFFIHRLSNKAFLIWLLTAPPYLKYASTLPCNLLLVSCFVDNNN